MKRFSYLYAIFAFSILFISCFNEQNSGTFLVFSSNARAANASVENLTNITLKGESSDGDKLEYFWESYEPFISSRIELNPGLWDFTLRAFIEEVEYEANVQAEIQAERENHVKFILKALSSESGEGESVSEPEEINTIYVSEEGSEENSGISKDSPLDSIDSAIDVIMDLNMDLNKKIDWTISISGEVCGTHIINIPDSYMSSLTITGGSGAESAILNGNEEGTVLSISTSVPVIIKNLKITGGKTSGSGGGLNIGSSASVTLADGAVIAGNTASSGGGVYNEGKLFMYGSAVIGNASTASVATESDNSNSSTSGNGGGIFMNFDSAYIYLGYSDESTKKPLTGGIYHNYTKGDWTSGGGITVDKGHLYMASGNICYNSIGGDRPGGGVFISDSSDFTMSDGTISYNQSNLCGSSEAGGGIRLGGTFTMTGGSITNNTIAGTTIIGAGISVGSSATFIMTGGILKDNAGANINIENSGSPTITIGETAVTSSNISTYNTEGIEL